MGVVVSDAVRIYYTTDAVLSGGVRVYESNCFSDARIAIQPIFSGYTNVTVKLQVTLDGTTWADITGASTATSGDIVTVDLLNDSGPYQKFSIHVTATASGSDSLAIWLRRQPQG